MSQTKTDKKLMKNESVEEEELRGIETEQKEENEPTPFDDCEEGKYQVCLVWKK